MGPAEAKRRGMGPANGSPRPIASELMKNPLAKTKGGKKFKRVFCVFKKILLKKEQRNAEYL
jgi:hypothetical protein